MSVFLLGSLVGLFAGVLLTILAGLLVAAAAGERQLQEEEDDRTNRDDETDMPLRRRPYYIGIVQDDATCGGAAGNGRWRTSSPSPVRYSALPPFVPNHVG